MTEYDSRFCAIVVLNRPGSTICNTKGDISFVFGEILSSKAAWYTLQKFKNVGQTSER
jgi:hypothetical protein